MLRRQTKRSGADFRFQSLNQEQHEVQKAKNNLPRYCNQPRYISISRYLELFCAALILVSAFSSGAAVFCTTRSKKSTDRSASIFVCGATTAAAPQSSKTSENLFKFEISAVSQQKRYTTGLFALISSLRSTI